MTNIENQTLGRFGHHPDPAIDFETEVEDLVGLVYNHNVGFFPEPDLALRLERALDFRVGGVPSCVEAMRMLRELELN